MPSDPFAYASAAELAALIRTKQASATEVM
jgi:hypothetical protein